MLPQLPTSLQSNIDIDSTNVENPPTSAFLNVYKILTGQVLDHDGSTRSKNHHYEATGTAAKLHEDHVRQATNGAILRTLRDLCLLDSKHAILSNELRQLCSVVSAYLVSVQVGLLQVNEEVETLMAEEVTEFRGNLPAIATAVSKHVIDVENIIIKMLRVLVQPPESNQAQLTDAKSSRIPAARSTTAATRSYKSIATQSTTDTSATILQTLRQKETDIQNITIPQLLRSLTTTLNALLAAQSDLLTSQIRHAELHTHSTQSRYLTTHATFLSTVAQGLNLKAQILALQREKEVYAQEGVRETLRRKWEELSREERGLREREERLSGLLREFRDAEEGMGGGGEGVFEKLGRGYAEVEAEIEVVRRDVERLEREVQETGSRGGAGERRGRGIRR